MRAILAAAAAVSLAHPAFALEPWPSGRLELELQKLDSLGSVLYVAAHPDDENTTLITYLANEQKLRTTYLSLTRGDGGQNLLGTDLGEKLGVIRTQELLAARKLDGGEQRFSRAIDFGFSKTPEETLRIWGEQEILADLVWTIRLTQPDVIITRFPMQAGITHGHHTASTWLAKKAFTAAADANAFPEQLKSVKPWSAKRLIWNTSSWFYGSRDATFDPTGKLTVDDGIFNPLLGKSYPEIAATSRSSHKTQGFGTTPKLGSSTEYFEPLEGEFSTKSLLDGVDTSWNRVADSEPVETAIQQAIANFSPTQPDRCVPHLIAAHRALSALPDQYWKTCKLRDLERVIAACLGLDVECVTATPSAVAGSNVSFELRAIQRSEQDVSISFLHDGKPLSNNEPFAMQPNLLLQTTGTIRLPLEPGTSQPYWLAQPHGTGAYTVNDPQLIGVPENPPALPVQFQLTVNGYALNYEIPTDYVINDPVRGEVKEPFVVTPPAMINLGQSIQIFGDPSPQTLTARVIAKQDLSGATLRFLTDGGWQVEPAESKFDLEKDGELSIEVKVTPPSTASSSALKAELEIDGQTYNRGFERLDYDHIPVQTLFPLAEEKLVSLEVKHAGSKIGYIPGAGDEIPAAMRSIGYTVDMLGEADMQQDTLAPYDAIVLGIRVLNTNDRIGFYFPALFKYAENGGTVILQYNTNGRLKTSHYSPFPFNISRDRVTDESAEMRILAPDHRVMNFPNKITAADFDGWVQERGLYFPTEWDPAFTPIFSANDADESPLDGSLLIANYGKGWYVQSSLSWFRQLPAGVPGAYRIFANLLSLGHSE